MREKVIREKMASSYTNKHRKIHSEHHKCLKMEYEVCKVDENFIVTVIFLVKEKIMSFLNLTVY